MKCYYTRRNGEKEELLVIPSREGQGCVILLRGGRGCVTHFSAFPFLTQVCHNKNCRVIMKQEKQIKEDFYMQEDLLKQLIQQFGLWIIGALILLGALVWGITHLNAKPGEKVSILWGMVEYIKDKPQPELEKNLVQPKQKPKQAPEIISEPPAQPQPAEPPEGQLQGKITLPHSESHVPRWFKVRGSVSGPHRHLWLIERVGQLYWPKEPELTPQNRQWVGKVNEGGYPPGGNFELLLVDVSDNISERFGSVSN